MSHSNHFAMEAASRTKSCEQHRQSAATEQQLSYSDRALQAIAGEQSASGFLQQLRSQQATPEDLAAIVSMLYGDALHGFCRVIAKALGVRHG